MIWGEGRRVGGESRQVEEEWNEEEEENIYRRALTEAAAIANRSVSKGFEESRQKVWAEFNNFLERVGHGLRAETACDLDVIAFVQGFWIPEHKRNCRTRMGEDGEKVASASAVKGMIQQIAKSYSMKGRTDGMNPAKQESVKSYCDGYRMWLKENRVRERRAKVFKERKVSDLVEHLERRVKESGGLRRCVLMMDLAAVDYLWESWARGKECGELRVDQIDFESQVVSPGWSKTVQNEPSASIDMSGARGGRFIRSAVALIREMEKQGHPIGTGSLFRPINRQTDGFTEECLSASALRKRIQQHLKDAGLFEGETLHSFRRSAVQGAAEIEGFDVAKLMALGRWKSYAAFRIYVEEIEGSFPRRM
jgi:integrase